MTAPDGTLFAPGWVRHMRRQELARSGAPNTIRGFGWATCPICGKANGYNWVPGWSPFDTSGWLCADCDPDIALPEPSEARQPWWLRFLAWLIGRPYPRVRIIE